MKDVEDKESNVEPKLRKRNALSLTEEKLRVQSPTLDMLKALKGGNGYWT